MATVTVFQDITARKQMENELRESRKQLRALSMFLQTVREEERKRIARELHDELGQALTALKIDLDWLEARCSNMDGRVAEKFRSMDAILGKTVESVRSIAEDLRPGMLDDLGLAAAIEWQVEKFQERTAIQCELSMNRDEFELDERVATSVFRIVQEALTNVARHAAASKVRIVVEERDDEIHLEISDNGKGFQAGPKKRSYGLLGIRERVNMLGGAVEISSQPGAGTAVRATIPLHGSGDRTMIRILIADDHTILRDGLKQILSECHDMVVAGEADNGNDALKKIREEEWNVVVLDMSMPGKSGIELIKQIKSEKPKLPILILSMHKEDVYAVRTLKAGASGYLSKDSASAQLVSAIRKVASGGSFHQPEVAEKLAYGLRPMSDAPRTYAALGSRVPGLHDAGAGQGVSPKSPTSSI